VLIGWGPAAKKKIGKRAYIPEVVKRDGHRREEASERRQKISKDPPDYGNHRWSSILVKRSQKSLGLRGSRVTPLSEK